MCRLSSTPTRLSRTTCPYSSLRYSRFATVTSETIMMETKSLEVFVETNFFALSSFERSTRTRKMRTSTQSWWATEPRKDIRIEILFLQVRGYLDFDVEMENVGVFWSGTEALLLEYRWKT